MDAIEIKGLRVSTHIGVTDEERSVAQTVVIDLVVEADLARAEKSNDVSETVDYTDVVGRVQEVVASARCNLLETLAGKIAAVVAAIPGVDGVTVEIAKEPPPVAADVERIAVRLKRP